MKLSEVFSKHGMPELTPCRPYVIAEVGVNHEGSMELAKRLVAEASEGGAHGVKFQTYKAHLLASKHSPAYWDRSKEPTASQYKLFRKYDSFWKNEYEELKEVCDRAGVDFLSTPFDVESAKFLADLMYVVKISSSDITNFPFIENLCSYKKPILLSTGASHLWEVQEAVSFIKSKSCRLCLMHSILNYPTMDEHANLGMILDLKRRFPECAIGYSDHTLPKDMDTLLIATLLGSVVLEKHFTHDKSLPGNDHYHAMDKTDLKLFWKKIEKALALIGTFIKAPLPTENIARENARRSLVAAVYIAKNTTITKEHLTWKRPASGISPRAINEVIGRKAMQDIPEDTPLDWSVIGK